MIEVPKVLEQVEELLKDRFGAYLVVATDGENVYAHHSGNVAAIGLARYAQLQAEQSLSHDATEDS